MPYSRYFFIVFFPLFFLAADMSHAGPLLYRVQQEKATKQRQSQMTQEQYQQYQEYQEQQQGDHAQEAAPAPPTYQQTVDQRNQAIAQAILSAHNQAVSSESEPLGNNAGTGQTQQQTTYPAAQQQAAPQALPSDAQDTVDLSEVWKKLDKRSTVWTLLIDDQAKVLTVSEYIDRFHKEGVKINEPPLHYAQMIDQVVGQNPQLLNRPFGELLQMMAIVDYDFDNGMNKDDLARKVLGEEGYEANKKRFSQPQPQGPSA